jgi:hypothetical protein
MHQANNAWQSSGSPPTDARQTKMPSMLLVDLRQVHDTPDLHDLVEEDVICGCAATDGAVKQSVDDALRPW